jgi:uncharacterized protein YndB with AHSA1/START domain
MTCSPVVGHQFQFHTRPVAGWDGTIDCEVLVVEPERRLVYTWRGGSSEIQGYGHRLDTTVTWTLSVTPGGGTHVHLEHAGFTEADTFAYENMGNGWRDNVVGALTRVVAELSRAGWCRLPRRSASVLKVRGPTRGPSLGVRSRPQSARHRYGSWVHILASRRLAGLVKGFSVSSERGPLATP